MIERNFDVPFIANLALREKQIQQNYRPIIAVHKWFARRPGTLFRGLLLAEFLDEPLSESFYQSQDLEGLWIADPFMGGGSPLIEANRVGSAVIGVDINPMAYWIVKQEIEHVELPEYVRAASRLREELKNRVGHLYETRCHECGEAAYVKYFLWVKRKSCEKCGHCIDLFPGYLVAKDVRHPRTVLVCPGCGDLNEVENRKSPGLCRSCRFPLSVTGPAQRNQCVCSRCGQVIFYGKKEPMPPGHRMFAIEYHCVRCRRNHPGRFFKKPDRNDIARYQEACSALQNLEAAFVPDESIPPGDETNRLHRWGYKRYQEMFNARQLYGLELSCRLIRGNSDERIRNALATNLSDLLRYQNMLCRYDTMALKSLDIFSVHGFPVGLVQCESNLLGIESGYKDMSIGSGGWSNIIGKFIRAKGYCEKPFEVRHKLGRKMTIPIHGEWIGDNGNGQNTGKKRIVKLSCGDASQMDLPKDSLDAVLTDPPYFGNVQYAELMDFCYVWLRRLVVGLPQFEPETTRNPDELTVNENMGRGLESFAQRLSSVFHRWATALKPGKPFAFTYHHNNLEAYYPIAVAVLDAGLTCSASLPCPAEMGASIHIKGTKSSIIDTVFVCRSKGRIPQSWISETPAQLASLVLSDLAQLEAGKVKLTRGDVRCIVFGHLTRLAIWFLRTSWEPGRTIKERIRSVREWISAFGGLTAVEVELEDMLSGVPNKRGGKVVELEAVYNAEISF